MTEHVGPGLPGAMQDGNPPWSKEAEVAVLGAMAIDGEAAATTAETLGADDFHAERHRRIFAAVSELHGRGEVVDVVTLSDELKSRGELDAAGGMEYLARLVDAVPTPANVAHHASVLRRKAVLRKLIDAAREIDQDARAATGGEVGKALEAARERLRAVEERVVDLDRDALRTAREILDDPDAHAEPPVVADRMAWRGRTVLFSGREKSGKSSVWRWAVARRSRGRGVWGGTPLGAPVETLYWAEEPPVDVAADLDRFDADLSRVHIRDMRSIAGDRFGALRRDLEGVAPELVVVDTLPTFVDDQRRESGESSDWAPVMNRLARLALDHDAALGILHHATKGDGSYRDSTAIGAGVDCILEMRRDPAEGEKVRKVTAYPRSSIRVQGYAYRLAGTDEAPRMELVDGSLSLEERVVRFVDDHPGCSQVSVREGVKGRDAKIMEALSELSGPGGPLVCDDSSTPYEYRTAKTRTEQGRNRLGTGSEQKAPTREADAVPGPPHTPKGGGGPEQPAGSVGDDRQPKRCACGQRIGPTSTSCGRCKKKRREVQGRLPDPGDVVQVGETFPHSDVRAT